MSPWPIVGLLLCMAGAQWGPRADASRLMCWLGPDKAAEGLQCSWGWCPVDPGAGVCPLVGGAGSLAAGPYDFLGLVPAHWCAGLGPGPTGGQGCPGAAVGSGGLKSGCLLVGGAGSLLA